MDEGESADVVPADLGLEFGDVILEQDRDLEVFLEVAGHAAGVHYEEGGNPDEEQHQAYADYAGKVGVSQPAPHHLVFLLGHITPI